MFHALDFPKYARVVAGISVNDEIDAFSKQIGLFDMPRSPSFITEPTPGALLAIVLKAFEALYCYARTGTEDFLTPVRHALHW